MELDVTIELLKLIPDILWFALIAVLCVFYRPIRDELLPRLSKVKLPGIEFEFFLREMGEAVESRRLRTLARPIEVSGDERSLVWRRAQRLLPLLRGFRVLWIDDNPDGSINEYNILRHLGMSVDLAETSAEAESKLSQTRYDLIISDIDREGNEQEGTEFLGERASMRARGLYFPPLIFYIYNLEEERGAPAYAFGITNRPNQLLHLVFDALERERSH